MSGVEIVFQMVACMLAVFFVLFSFTVAAGAALKTHSLKERVARLGRGER